MSYAAGHFYMPGGGSISISTGFQPQGVMFFGSNQAAEDTVLTTTNAGLFFGMSWTPVGGGIDQQALFNGHGDYFNFSQAAITCGAAGGTTEYRGTVSHDADGFTVSVSTGAPGSRLIHYLAYGDMAGAGGTTATEIDGVTHMLSLGYRAMTGLMFHFIPAGGVRERVASGGTFMSLATSNWPEDEEDPGPVGIRSSGGGMVFRQGTQLGIPGYVLQATHSTANQTRSSFTRKPGAAAGSFIESYDHLYPEPWPGNGTDIEIQTWGDNSRHSVAWWTSEGYVQYLGDSPNIAAEATYSAPDSVGNIEAALIYGTTGWHDVTGGSTPNMAFVLGVLTEDYQGCVGLDWGTGAAPATGTPRFFQSKELFYIDNLYSASGIRAASGEIQGATVVLTGEIADSLPDGQGSLMQVWGEDDSPDMWIMEV